MIMRKSLIAVFVGVASVMGVTASAQTDNIKFTQYVNPFIGTEGTGHTFPGACLPFGLVQTSPVTGAIGWNYCAEYVDSDK